MELYLERQRLMCDEPIIYVMAPQNNPNSGGVLWLHSLVDLINQCGTKSYIVPWRNSFVFPEDGIFLGIFRVAFGNFARRVFHTLTSVMRGENYFRANPINDGKNIIIYADTVIGNPYNFRNVCRFLLHIPGFFSQKSYYGTNEFWISGGHVTEKYRPINGRKFSEFVDLSSIPDVYFENYQSDTFRAGVAYSIRKGTVGNNKFHDDSSVCIDGLEHTEVAKIFQKVELFISYDPYSAYSTFAAISGCISVVIPDPRMTSDEWRPDPRDRYGVAYGFEDVERAKNSIPDLLLQIRSKKENQINIIRRLVNEIVSQNKYTEYGSSTN